MTKYLIVLLGVVLVVPSFGADVFLKAGMNNSWFATEGGTSESKPAYGIGLLFTVDKSSRTKIGIDLLYVQQKMILKDINWPAHSPLVPDECGATVGDFHLHYYYLKIPVYFCTTLIQKQDFSTHFKYGLSMNRTLESNSKSKNFKYNPDMCTYDYKRVESDRQPKYPIELLLGCSLGYKAFEIEALYTLTLWETEFMSVLDIQDRINSIRIMVNLRLGLKNKQYLEERDEDVKL